MDSRSRGHAHLAERIATRPTMRGVTAFPWVTGILVAVVLLAWVLVAVQQGLAEAAGGLRHTLLHGPSDAVLLGDGALNGATLAAGEWWRLLTSQLLHAKLGHMLFNALGLAVVGTVLERRVGSWWLLIIAVVGGICGQLASVLAYPALVSSGVSQAALALTGALDMVIIWQRWRGDTRQDAPGWIGTAGAALYLCVSLTLDLSTAHTVKAGHVAAFVAGVLLALALRYSMPAYVRIAR